MKNLSVSKLANIKNYEAGKNGNLLVILTDKLIPVSVVNPHGVEKDVQVLICTATISEKSALDLLESHVDESTPCNKVIAVSKKFLSLSNKKQLVLLELENQKVRFEKEKPDSNIATTIQAEINTIEKFGKVAERFAVRTSRRFREKSQRKAATGLHRAYKKDQAIEKKLRKVAKSVLEKNQQTEVEENFTEPVTV